MNDAVKIMQKWRRARLVKKQSEISPQEERLHQLLTEQSDELRNEIIAFFEEGKKQKTIWERIRRV